MSTEDIKNKINELVKNSIEGKRIFRKIEEVRSCQTQRIFTAPVEIFGLFICFNEYVLIFLIAICCYHQPCCCELAPTGFRKGHATSILHLPKKK